MTSTPHNTYEEAAQIDHLHAEALEVAEQAAPLVTVTEDNLHDASEALVRCTRILKDAEGLRVAMTKPLLDHKRYLDGLIKDRVAPVQDMADRLRAAITAFNTARERERQERERAARAVLAQRQHAAEGERARLAEAVGVQPEDIPVMDLTTAVVVAPLDTEVVTASGTITSRAIVKVTVTDAEAVPRPWCVPDAKRIEAFVKAAVKDDPDSAERTVREVFGGSVSFETVMTTVVSS